MASLPGVRTVLQDKFYTISREHTNNLPKVVIIGRRNNEHDPDDPNSARDYYGTYIQSEREVEIKFGRGSELHKGYLEAMSGGASQVYVVAIPSDVEDADYLDVSPDNPFDKAFDEAETLLPDFIVPYGRGGNASDYTPTGSDPSNPEPPEPDPYGFYADFNNGVNSLVNRIAEKAASIIDRTHPCIVVIGVKPFTDDEDMSASDVANHLQFPSLPDRNADQASLSSYLISVVAAETRPIGFPIEFGWTNSAAHYAGFVSSIAANRSTTNKVVQNLQGLRYNPNRSQKESMGDRGLVAIGLDSSRTPLWVDGVTFGKATSDFVRLSTLRIVFEVIRMVRQVSRKFIGEPSSMENRNAFETGITAGLRNFQLTGGLLGSDFIVNYYPREGSAIVDLVLQPAFEIRNIEINVSIQF